MRAQLASMGVTASVEQGISTPLSAATTPMDTSSIAAVIPQDRDFGLGVVGGAGRPFGIFPQPPRDTSDDNVIELT